MTKEINEEWHVWSRFLIHTLCPDDYLHRPPSQKNIFIFYNQICPACKQRVPDSVWMIYLLYKADKLCS